MIQRTYLINTSLFHNYILFSFSSWYQSYKLVACKIFPMSFRRIFGDHPALFLVMVAAVWSSFQPFCSPIWSKKSKNRFARYGTSLPWKELRRFLPHASPRVATSFCLFQLRTILVTTTPRCHHNWKNHFESNSTPSKSKPSDTACTPTRRLKILVHRQSASLADQLLHAPLVLPLCHVSHSARDTSALAPDHRHLSPSTRSSTPQP